LKTWVWGYFFFSFFLATTSGARDFNNPLSRWVWFLKHYPRWGTCEEASQRVKGDFIRATGIAPDKVEKVDCHDPMEGRHGIYNTPYLPPYSITIHYWSEAQIQRVSTDTEVDGFTPEDMNGEDTVGFNDAGSCFAALFGNTYTQVQFPDIPFLPPKWDVLISPQAEWNQVKRFYFSTGLVPAAAFCFPADVPFMAHPWIMRIDGFGQTKNNVRPFVYKEWIPVEWTDKEKAEELDERVQVVHKFGFPVALPFFGHDNLMGITFFGFLYYGTSKIAFQRDVDE
jgi:hypothetical protein